MMTIKNQNRTKELEKAKTFVKKMGFIFDEHPRYLPAIKLTEGSDFKVVKPIFFEIGEDKLIEITQNIKSLGLCAPIVLKAIVKAYSNLTQAESDDFRNCCWVTSYTPSEFLEFIYNWTVAQLEVQKISIGTNVTKKTMRNIWFSLGGYRGIKKFIEDGYTVALHEFRRVRSIEEKIEKAEEVLLRTPAATSEQLVEAKCVLLDSVTTSIDGITLKKAHTYAEFNPCMTCAHSKIDRYGARTCKACWLHIDPTMTVGEVNKLYPSASIKGYGVLRSKYVLSNVHRCSYYKERIGCKIKSTRNYSQFETFGKEAVEN